MSDFVTALTVPGTAVAVGTVMVARSWPAPARHRGSRRVAELLSEFVPLDELLTAEAEFDAEYGDTFAPDWRSCPGHDTPASDGWWCPACRLPIPSGGAPWAA